MTEQNAPSSGRGGLPPDLPPEFADAYLRGYQRAYDSSHDAPPLEEPVAEPGYESDLFADVEPERWEEPTHRRPGDPDRPGWFVPVLLGTLVLALILGAYGAGRLFSTSVGPGPSGDERLEIPDEGSGVGTGNSNSPKPVSGEAWDGGVRPVSNLHAASSCVLPPGTDAAGRKVDYTPDRATDGDFTTAWRCAGEGVGVTLQIELGRQVRLGEVGLVPGYAKTDPQSHADRYAENNRITKVRWTFSNDSSVVERLSGSPTLRELQSLRIPPVRTDSVTIEVLSSVRGPRNTIAISEVQLGETID